LADPASPRCSNRQPFGLVVNLKTAKALGLTIRLRLMRFTPTRFAFEIASKVHKYVEVTYVR
jgi:hypothetical protein